MQWGAGKGGRRDCSCLGTEHMRRRAPAGARQPAILLGETDGRLLPRTAGGGSAGLDMMAASDDSMSVFAICLMEEPRKTRMR